jgi:hypothetical protein
MTKHLIYFRDTDGDHLVYLEVADEQSDDAAPQIYADDLDPAIELGVMSIAGAARPHEGGRRIG